MINNEKIISHHTLPNKSVVLYADGSGASIVKRIDEHYFFYVDDDEKTPCTTDDIHDAGFFYFVPLSDKFKTWDEFK